VYAGLSGGDLGGRRFGQVFQESAEGVKNREPVTAVEKSRMRSYPAVAVPRNIGSSIVSVTSGLRA
jgi:hypothetical protein